MARIAPKSRKGLIMNAILLNILWATVIAFFVVMSLADRDSIDTKSDPKDERLSGDW